MMFRRLSFPKVNEKTSCMMANYDNLSNKIKEPEVELEAKDDQSLGNDIYKMVNLLNQILYL